MQGGKTATQDLSLWFVNFWVLEISGAYRKMASKIQQTQRSDVRKHIDTLALHLRSAFLKVAIPVKRRGAQYMCSHELIRQLRITGPNRIRNFNMKSITTFQISLCVLRSGTDDDRLLNKPSVDVEHSSISRRLAHEVMETPI